MTVRRADRVVRAMLAAIVMPGAASAAMAAEPPKLAAPNVVEISPWLVTSGQPTPAGLASLKSLGFEAVVYLAPPTVGDAVRDEATIVGRQGLVYVNLPVDFEAPTSRDVDAFVGVLDALRGRKVLVHCQVNLRASSMVFLYRVVALKEEPRVAYAAVSGVWAPHGAWRRLIETELARRGIRFELL